MSSIRVEGLCKRYGRGGDALADVTLEVRDGELMAVVGPSGCGKSTLLRVVAGLERPSSGRVLIGDRDVTGVAPQDRDLAMVFQSYALYPHMSVRENLAFGLRVRDTARSEIARRVDAVAERLGISGLLDARPASLSGGERQRVALGRAIVREPRAFLLDEPLSNLDAALRVRTRAEIARLHRELDATMLYVTHDQEEAMMLGDRVAVLRDGRLQQVAPPLEVYRRPANAFVAGFVGTPAMNLVRARVEREGGRAIARCEVFEVEVEESVRASEVLLGIRPHDVEIDPHPRERGRWRVEVVEHRGNDTVVALEAVSADVSITAVVDASAALDAGACLDAAFPGDRVHVFDAASGARLGP